MSEETKTTRWFKHGPAFDADANCDVWGITDEPYERGEEQTMLAWVYHEGDAEHIVALHNAALEPPAADRALIEEASELFEELSRFFGEYEPFLKGQGGYEIGTATEHLDDRIDAWLARLQSPSAKGTE